MQPPKGRTIEQGATMSQEFKSEPPKKTREQIQEEIERTRSALSNDIHALGEKLSPEHLKEGAKDVIREAKTAAADSIREARTVATDSIREAKDAAFGSLREAKDHAIESVSETVGDIGRRAQRVGYATSDFVSTHAVPLTLVGLGVGWLMLSMNHQKKRSQGYLQSRNEYDREYDRAPRGSFASSSDWDRYDDAYARREGYARRQASSIAEEARQRASAVAQRAQHGLEETGNKLRETVEAARSRVDSGLSDLRGQAADLRQHASEIGHDLREQAVEVSHKAYQQAADMSHQAYQQLQRAQTRTREFADENPLAVGALAVIAGVGVGLMLPPTQRENRLLGEARDKVWDDAQRTASRLGETVQRSAGELRGALLEQQQQQLR